jgi:hypothetical protein
VTRFQQPGNSPFLRFRADSRKITVINGLSPPPDCYARLGLLLSAVEGDGEGEGLPDPVTG